MWAEGVEWCCEMMNESFSSAVKTSDYVIPLGDEALTFAQSAWNIAMILAAVVFAIIACYELYAQAIRTEGHGGPMGNAEIVFKVMFKVAVCYIVLQVSFDLLQGLYGTFNELINGFGGIEFDPSEDPVLDSAAIAEQVPGGFAGIGAFLAAIVALLLCWAAKIFAMVLVSVRVIQVYLYLCIAPIPLATFPSNEYSQIGKSFLKSFVAVALQGALVYLVVRILPALLLTIVQTDFYPGDSILAALGWVVVYAVAILITLAGTQQMSQRICGST